MHRPAWVATLERMLAAERQEKEILQAQLESSREESRILRMMMAQQQQVALERNRVLERCLLSYVSQDPPQQEDNQQQGQLTALN